MEVKNKRNLKSIFFNTCLVSICVSLLGCYLFYNVHLKEILDQQRYARSSRDQYKQSAYEVNRKLWEHQQIVQNYYQKRKHWKTSNLGSILFKNMDTDFFNHGRRENKLFRILMWNFQPRSNNTKVPWDQNTLDECCVKNCIIDSNISDFDSADAVVIDMRYGKYPTSVQRKLNQRWIFLSEESPKHTFRLAYEKPDIRSMGNIFNWTMNYRSDSDVPIPYGRTIPLPQPAVTDPYEEDYLLRLIIPNWSKKQLDVVIVILMSNCKIKSRNDYIRRLKKHLDVDVLGGCAKKIRDKYICPRISYQSNCYVLSKYLFYLAFENSMCRQYITEKVFYNAYSMGAIPIIIGAPLADCEKLLPPNSFIHIDNYKSPADLAKDVKRIIGSETLLLSYHRWRIHFRLTNELGHFNTKSQRLCRLCEALNFNDGGVSIYDSDMLRLFFDKTLVCSSKI